MYANSSSKAIRSVNSAFKLYLSLAPCFQIQVGMLCQLGANLVGRRCFMIFHARYYMCICSCSVHFCVLFVVLCVCLCPRAYVVTWNGLRTNVAPTPCQLRANSVPTYVPTWGWHKADAQCQHEVPCSRCSTKMTSSWQRSWHEVGTKLARNWHKINVVRIWSPCVCMLSCFWCIVATVGAVFLLNQAM